LFVSKSPLIQNGQIMRLETQSVLLVHFMYTISTTESIGGEDTEIT